MGISGQRSIVCWSAGAVLAVSAGVTISHPLGHHAAHMALHVLLMNVLAPFVALLVVSRLRLNATGPFQLWTAALIQIVLLWTAHTPLIQNLVVSRPGFQASLHGVLTLAALVFWITLLMVEERRRWHGVLALALTGKLVCLLAVLLVLAPRLLYGLEHPDSPHLSVAGAAIDDQRLAGLMMIAACPLSYLVAAIIISVQLLLPERKQSALAHVSG